MLGSLRMSPCFQKEHVIDCLWSYPEFGREFVAGDIARSEAGTDLVNGDCRQNSVTRHLSSGISFSALALHVGQVVSLCSEKQVVRSHAKGSVTSVTDDKSWRYWAVRNGVDESVRRYQSARPVRLYVTSTKKAVRQAASPPLTTPGPNPHPATGNVGLVNLHPKALDKSHGDIIGGGYLNLNKRSSEN